MNDFRKYYLVRILNEYGELADGEYIMDNMIVRIKDGFLNDAADENGDTLPAIELHDGSHIEHWKEGALHCTDGPAVIDSEDGYESWFLNGIECPPPGEKKGIAE